MPFISPVIDVFVFSFFVILAINIFYKILIDQNQAKQLREKMKEVNEQIKEEQKKGNTEKVNKLFGELMQENSKLMKMSLKPMAVSFVIILLALPWFGGIYGDKEVKLNDGKGELAINGASYTVQKTSSGIDVSGVGQIDLPKNGVDIDGYKWNIAMNGESVKFSRIIAYLPFAFPFVGTDLGWLGWYFLSAMLFIIITRKFLKIYL